MSKSPAISFAKPSPPKKGSVVVLAPEGGRLSASAAACDPANVLKRAFQVSDFTGKLAAKIDVLIPEATGFDQLIAVGAGAPDKLSEQDWLKIGGATWGALGNAGSATVVLELDGYDITAADVAGFALGVLLRAYVFDRYKTEKNSGKSKSDKSKTKSAGSVRVVLQCANPAAARRTFAEARSIADGVCLARDLVNEPANLLGPSEFAAKAKQLEALGVKVEVLTEKDMAKLKMDALLAVGRGSSRPPRMAVMQWKGGKTKDKPLAFIGKGVVFDTGGISMKPAGGMEDMKGDMGGAAAVIGVMHTLAARKAKANVVGIIGLAENMPDGDAQRPGDIVTSMSGQTIEVLNTDAEGRLVLADALTYCGKRFKPRFMINLATLTGAIMVALGKHHAGLFCNDDALAAQIFDSGTATAEKVWRMPLGSDYDKMIDSKNADMKNIGGRWGGAITAAQFLKRYVGETPWAHLDIAGTAMGSPSSEINRSWASGFGVRLLDRLVRDHYEA